MYREKRRESRAFISKNAFIDMSPVMNADLLKKDFVPLFILN